MTAAGAGPIRPQSQPRGLAPVREVLENGVVVLAKETPTTPAVTLHLDLRAGTADDPPDLPGLAHFMSRTIDRGTERHSADAIAEELDSRGVTLSSTIGRHTLSLVCTCLVEDFDHVLTLLSEIVMQPAFPSLEVDRRRGEIITLIRQDEDSPAAVAVETLMSMLYGESHPYGRRARGSVESVGHVDRQSLQRFHAARCAPAALSLVCVGDVEPGRAIDAARSAFGEWRSGVPSPPPDAAVPAPRERRSRLVPMMNKAQADIAYGFVAVRRADPSYHAHLLMNNILGQYSLGGRLGDSIREQQGMAYYVFSSLDANLMPGPLVIRAGVSADNVRKAVASIDAELSKLLMTGPAEQELAESKQYLIGSMPRTLETNMGIAAYLQTLELFGLGLDYDVRMPELLRAVTRDQVHEAARAAIDPSRATVVVAGPYEGPLT
jgi:zinc protease